MRTLYTAIVCTAWALATLPSLVQADEFDDFLNNPAAVVSESPAAADDRELRVEELPIEPRSDANANFGETVSPTFHQMSTPQLSEWPAVVSPIAHQHAAAHTPPQAEEPSATGLSLVPEPSAVALAALALVYFLVFGRRRTLG